MLFSSRAALDDAPHPLAPWRATLLLLAALAVGLGILFGGQHASRRVSTDVLELLPRDQLDSTIKLARQTVSGRFGRTLLFALADPAHPDKPPTQAAAAMGAELAGNPAFSGVFTGLTSEGKDRLQQWFFDRRLALRLPVWLDGMSARWRKEKGPSAPADPDPAWLAAAAEGDLQEFQNTSDALAYQERLPSDPLLLIPGLLTAFGSEDRATASDVAGGALAAIGPDGVHYALIQAEIKASPLTEPGQKPVFAAIDNALKTAQAKFGAGLTLRYTGVNKFAAETRERLEQEVGLLTNISLALSCLLLFIAFRRLSIFVYLLLPIVTATVWSLVVCFALFDTVHLMTIIFTTVLVGVALDYGIYTLSHARQTEGGMAHALRDIRFPLVAGCLTSVGGFVFMTLANLPMLQQMGVAVALGLILSLTLDFVYLPWIPALRNPARERDEGTNTLGRRLSLRAPFPLLAVVALLVAGGLVAGARVRWSDDVRSLDVMSPGLQDEQTLLRGLFGQSKKQRIVLTSGSDLDAAFANLERFNATLIAASKDPADRFINFGRLLPTATQSARCATYFRAHPDFAASLRAALEKDFNADAFTPFWTDWKSWQDASPHAATTPVQLIQGLRDVLPLPLQNLWNDEQPGSAWLATRVSEELYNKLPPGTLAAPNAPIDQVETLNGALRRYRVTALTRGGIGLAFIALMVTFVYGWRRALFMMAVPAVSILLAVAVLGFMGQPLGLLHVVALLLGFCLASDYSIFLGSPGELPHSTHRAILLAASTALLSFTVLSFSKVEALKDICLTVTLVIGFVLALCETCYRLMVHGVEMLSKSGPS